MSGTPRPGAPSLTARVALSCIAILLAWAAPAAAVELDPSDAPLSGSTFQAADGNQEPTARSSSTGRRSRTPGASCTRPTRTRRTARSRAGARRTSPGEWDLTTSRAGSTRRKDNIRDAWAAVDQPGRGRSSYLGFARDDGGRGRRSSPSSSTATARLWDNGRARIPCRRDGDMLISFEPHGNDVEVVVQRWKTDGHRPGTGCARTGTLDDATRPRRRTSTSRARSTRRRSPTRSRRVRGPRSRPAASARPRSTSPRLLAEAFGDDCLRVHARSGCTRARRRRSPRTCRTTSRPQPIDAAHLRGGGHEVLRPRRGRRARRRRARACRGFEIFADYDGDGQLRRRRAVDRHRQRRALRARRHPAAGRSYTLREQLLPTRQPRATGAARSRTRARGGSAGRSAACAWGRSTPPPSPTRAAATSATGSRRS